MSTTTTYRNKEKEPTLVCSDQDMAYPYSIKEKEPTLVCSDQDMSYSIKEKEPTLICANQCWLFLLNAVWV
jgi:uncharacterized protein YbaR (Trm112 family)